MRHAGEAALEDERSSAFHRMLNLHPVWPDTQLPIDQQKGIDMPEFSGIHHLNFTVTDLERSAAWYRQVMGLNDGWEMEDTGGRGRKYVLLHPTSPLRIVLTRHQSNSNQPFSEYITGLDHIAFTVADRPALKAWCEHFDSLGVDRSEIKEGATGWLVTFRDPDNLQLEMYTAVK